MQRSPVVRVLAIIGGLIVFGIALRFIGLILTSLLPHDLMVILSEGWQLLYSVLSPALVAVAAVAILASTVWIAWAWIRRRI